MGWGCGLVHTAHAAHIAAGSRSSRGFGQIGHEALGGQHHLSDGSCVLQSGAGDLGGVNDACGDHILHVDLILGVEAVVGLVGRDDLVDDDAALEAGVLGDLAQRSLQSLQDDLCAGALVAFQRVAQLTDCGDGVDGGSAAARCINFQR